MKKLNKTQRQKSLILFMCYAIVRVGCVIALARAELFRVVAQIILL